MKKIVILCIALCNVYLVQAQEIKGIINDNKRLDNTTARNDSASLLDMEVMTLDKEFVLPYINAYETPYFDYTNPLGYSNSYIKNFSPNLSYSMMGRSDVWMGITTVNTAAFGLHYNPGAFSANITAEYWKYDFMGKAYKDGVVNADVSYELLSWLTFGAYGQYSIMSKNNFRHGSRLPTPMVPFTDFGGYSKIMFNSNFGIQGMIGRQFNAVLNKWETTYGFAPVIEFKKKKR